LITRLLENLTGKKSGLLDSEFDRFHQQEGKTFDVEYLDTIFSGELSPSLRILRVE